MVHQKDVNPLISMQEMTRCIHCTRCVRFGQEVAGVMELGMIHRGEHSEITTVAGDTIDSELSGTVIHICPVGALTSKPFRYSARTWELSRRKSVSPHDSTGANLIVQVKNHKVMRVLPFENEDVNECWIADRDRFSYEALSSDERLDAPCSSKAASGTRWDWQTALEYVANGLRCIQKEQGAQSIGALVSPSTAPWKSCIWRGHWCVGWEAAISITVFVNADFTGVPEGVRLRLGPIAFSGLSTRNANRCWWWAPRCGKDHPLFAQRIRQADSRKGCNGHVH